MKIVFYLIIASVCAAGAIFFGKIPKSESIQINIVNKSDREELELFFRILICENHFGYTLFGDKPISIAGYFLQQPTGNLLNGHVSNIKMDRLWKTWEKYSDQFEAKKYLIINEKTWENSRTITIINRRAFLEKVQEHLTDFQSILGKEITPEKLLDKLSVPNPNLFDILHRNEVLYGILLGYGKENALMYKRKSQLLRFADPEYHGMPIHKDPSQSYSLYFPCPSSPFFSIEEEYEYLQNQTNFLSSEPKLSHIDYPYFVASGNNLETHRLKQKYQQLHKKLVKIYSEGDFLSITLKRLYEEDSNAKERR